MLRVSQALPTMSSSPHSIIPSQHQTCKPHRKNGISLGWNSLHQLLEHKQMQPSCRRVCLPSENLQRCITIAAATTCIYCLRFFCRALKTAAHKYKCPEGQAPCSAASCRPAFTNCVLILCKRCRLPYVFVAVWM